MVEIHIPLGGPGPFSWIEQVESQLSAEEESGTLEVYDDGEEVDDHYLFFITGAPVIPLLQAASRVARLDGIPSGAFAMLTTSDAEEFGLGKRVPLPLSAPVQPLPGIRPDPAPTGKSPAMRDLLEEVVRQLRPEE